MMPQQPPKPPKRQASPSKPSGNASKSFKKTLTFPDEAQMTDEQIQDGGAHVGHFEASKQQQSENIPPKWFKDFECRQDQRFEKVARDFRDVCEGFTMEIDNMKGEIDALKRKLELTEIKIDDLENRSRRNNIVIFNLPEGTEGVDCTKYLSDLLNKECKIQNCGIQRAHRTGKPNPAPNNASNGNAQSSKPRPIHVGFGLYQDKELCRKALADLFRSKKIEDSKLYVANDFSQKVLQLRKAKLPQLRKLKNEGKNAFFVYPATIKVRESSGVVRDA